jgi:hypothetical protein
MCFTASGTWTAAGGSGGFLDSSQSGLGADSSNFRMAEYAYPPYVAGYYTALPAICNIASAQGLPSVSVNSGVTIFQRAVVRVTAAGWVAFCLPTLATGSGAICYNLDIFPTDVSLIQNSKPMARRQVTDPLLEMQERKRQIDRVKRLLTSSTSSQQQGEESTSSSSSSSGECGAHATHRVKANLNTDENDESPIYIEAREVWPNQAHYTPAPAGARGGSSRSSSNK